MMSANQKNLLQNYSRRNLNFLQDDITLLHRFALRFYLKYIPSKYLHIFSDNRLKCNDNKLTSCKFCGYFDLIIKCLHRMISYRLPGNLKYQYHDNQQKVFIRTSTYIPNSKLTRSLYVFLFLDSS